MNTLQPYRCASFDNQIVEMTIVAPIHHMLAPVGGKVRGWVSRGERRGCQKREVVMGNDACRPREGADVPVSTSVDDVVRTIASNKVGCRVTSGRRCVRIVCQVVVTDGARGPVEAMHVTIDTSVNRILYAVRCRNVCQRVARGRR